MDSYSYNVVNLDYTSGPLFGVAVIAWLLGTAGAVTVLKLRPRATPNQDGPFRKCVASASGAGTERLVGQP